MLLSCFFVHFGGPLLNDQGDHRHINVGEKYRQRLAMLFLFSASAPCTHAEDRTNGTLMWGERYGQQFQTSDNTERRPSSRARNPKRNRSNLITSWTCRKGDPRVLCYMPPKSVHRFPPRIVYRQACRWTIQQEKCSVSISYRCEWTHDPTYHSAD